MSDRRDAEVHPPTIRATPSFGEIRLTTRHHAWLSWAEVAIEHELEARQRRKTRDVFEFLPGMVAITAASFSLEALSKSVSREEPTRPPKRDDGQDANRGDAIGAQLGSLVSEAPAEWPDRLHDLFELRNGAVHFGEEDLPPVWHPTLESNVSEEVLRWGADAASNAVSLCLDVLDAMCDRPVAGLAERWSGFRVNVDELQSIRSGDVPPWSNQR